jgi:hypothetical protein
LEIKFKFWPVKFNLSLDQTILFAKSTFFHAGQREKKYFFHAEITFFHAGITFFHGAASSMKKSDSSVKIVIRA